MVRTTLLNSNSVFMITDCFPCSRYVLSPTHLHEFKSTDRSEWQAPVMSLYLPDQKLGSHSQPDSTSHKFMLKGRQTGTMHRGHSWVFRAESHDTMMAWYEDIQNLMARSGETRNAYVRRHYRSTSGASVMSNNTNDLVMDEDEADRTPYSADASVLEHDTRSTEERPQPGGRFPSDVQIDHAAGDPVSPSSGGSSLDKEFLTGTTADQGIETTHHHKTGHRLGADGRSLSERSESIYSSRPSQEREQQQPVRTAHAAAQTSLDQPAVSQTAARVESASTAPTSLDNNTELTGNNTRATSFDDERAIPVPNIAANKIRNQNVVEEEDSQQQQSSSQSKEGQTPSAYELKIPGRYPPRVSETVS